MAWILSTYTKIKDTLSSYLTKPQAVTVWKQGRDTWNYFEVEMRACRSVLVMKIHRDTQGEATGQRKQKLEWRASSWEKTQRTGCAGARRGQPCRYRIVNVPSVLVALAYPLLLFNNSFCHQSISECARSYISIVHLFIGTTNGQPPVTTRSQQVSLQAASFLWLSLQPISPRSLPPTPAHWVSVTLALGSIGLHFSSRR